MLLGYWLVQSYHYMHYMLQTNDSESDLDGI